MCHHARVSQTPADGAPAQIADASRRTRLASERTYLAWLRSGLTALAIGIGVAKLLPALGAKGPAWLDTAVGIGFCVLGILFAGYGMRRAFAVERALEEGSFAPLQDRVVWIFGIVAIALGLVTAVLVLVQT